MTSTNGHGHTSGPYHFRIYGQEPEEIEFMSKHGMKPTRMLTNEGQVAIMAGSGEGVKRIALIDCQTKYKRGEGYRTECAERDANARLIAVAPDLLAFAQWVADHGGENNQMEIFKRARAVLSRVSGEGR